MRRIVLLLSLLCSAPASADESALCLKAARVYEKGFSIRTRLLEVLTRIETGRGTDGMPWPWTINAEGASRFYDTKEEAVAAARALQKRGIVSFDVGCMQINMRYHATAFRTMGEAFDPGRNVKYAAKFLKSLYEKTGSWTEAAVRYHSTEEAKASRYRLKLAAMLEAMDIASLDGPKPDPEPAKVKAAGPAPSPAGPYKAIAGKSAMRRAVIDLERQVSDIERARSVNEWRARQAARYREMRRERGYKDEL